MLALRSLRAASAAACAAGLLGQACAPAPSPPREVLAAYLRWVGRDPARTLDLLAPEFHATHGLSMAHLEGVLWGGWQAASSGADLPGAAREAPDTPEARVESGRLAWLFVQRAKPFRDTVFGVELVEQQWQPTTGSVVLRLRSRRGDPFEQRFELSRRDATSCWRIHAIEQRGVNATNASRAFVAYPSLANLNLLKELAAARGRAEPSR